MKVQGSQIYILLLIRIKDKRLTMPEGNIYYKIKFKGTLSLNFGHFGFLLWKESAFFLDSLAIISFSNKAPLPIFSTAWRARKLLTGYSPCERWITIIIRFWVNDIHARLLYMYFYYPNFIVFYLHNKWINIKVIEEKFYAVD